MRIAVLLPSPAGGGGAHSVIQEMAELTQFGAQVRILVPERHFTSYRTQYPAHLIARLELHAYATKSELPPLLAERDIAIATMFMSVGLLREALAALPDKERPFAAYYIQDYEPLFCEPGTQKWQEAVDSYEFIKDCLLFAKTNWLCSQVTENHRRPVVKVEPSIDHSVYYPRLNRCSKTPALCAMIRPKTARRAPRRTARILNWIAEQWGENVRLDAFGCDESALRSAGMLLHSGVTLHGFLHRESVAELLRECDFFLDLSDYQAFGRTGMEAMACGCIPVMPLAGGPPEFVTDSVNGFLVDTPSDAAIMDTVRCALALSEAERQRMALAALETASRFTARRAALSEYRAFVQAIQA